MKPIRKYLRLSLGNNLEKSVFFVRSIPKRLVG